MNELNGKSDKHSLRCELLSILGNKQKCKQYKNFLVKRHCEENFLFWCDVQLFKNEEETPDDSIESSAQYPNNSFRLIFNVFFNLGSMDYAQVF